MSPSKQNLFLFFEENNRKSSINRKLVLLYANRCIIDEDAQFEICEVYELESVPGGPDRMVNHTRALYEMNATSKEKQDQNTFYEAFQKSYLHESVSIDTHFFIGSIFYTRQYPKNGIKNW